MSQYSSDALSVRSGSPSRETQSTCHDIQDEKSSSRLETNSGRSSPNPHSDAHSNKSSPRSQRYGIKNELSFQDLSKRIGRYKDQIDDLVENMATCEKSMAGLLERMVDLHHTCKKWRK